MRNDCVYKKHKILFAHTVDFVIYIVLVDFSLWIDAIACNIHERETDKERERNERFKMN